MHIELDEVVLQDESDDALERAAGEAQRGYTSASAQAVEQTTGKALAQSEPTAKPDSVALKPFLSKTVSVLTQGLKLGLSLVIQGSLKTTKFTAVASL